MHNIYYLPMNYLSFYHPGMGALSKHHDLLNPRLNIITLKLNLKRKTKQEFSLSSLTLQVYDLLPPKKAPTFMYGGFIDDDENDEKCTHVKDIVHDGIIYTPKWGVKDDDVLTIFAVIHLPKNINKIEF